MYEPTKLKNGEIFSNRMKSIQIYFNGEVLVLFSTSTDFFVTTLENWFLQNIGNWHNHTENEDLFSDIISYLSNNKYIKRKNLILKWKVYPFDNIVKERGFNIVFGQDGAIDVNYFNYIVRIEPWY